MNVAVASPAAGTPPSSISIPSAPAPKAAAGAPTISSRCARRITARYTAASCAAQATPAIFRVVPGAPGDGGAPESAASSSLDVCAKVASGLPAWPSRAGRPGRARGAPAAERARRRPTTTMDPRSVAAPASSSCAHALRGRAPGVGSAAAPEQAPHDALRSRTAPCEAARRLSDPAQPRARVRHLASRVRRRAVLRTRHR
jgi:hypothetical protein